jgi:hypothetical protein
MQDRLMNGLEERMRDHIHNLDPKTLIQTWIPATIQNLGELQKMLWNQMGMTQPESPKEK